MAILKRQWRASLVVIALLAGVFLLWGRKVEGHTPGDEVISVPTTFASLDNGIHDADPTVGVVEIDGNLTIASGGSITCNDPASPSGQSACAIKLVVTGNMVMDAGSKILAENNNGGGNGGNIDITVGGSMTLQGTTGGTAGAKISSSNTGSSTGVAGNITITVGNFAATPPTGDFTMGPGSQILANGTGSAGAIVIKVANAADVDGLVQSKSTLSGVGNIQPPGGGPITITAGCSLLVSDAGTVSSQGQDPGADLVHLQACVVVIDGLVQSTGPGHVIPNSPPNHCDNNGGVGGGLRPDKPANSTACVEIWAGDSLTLDSTGTHNGQVNADIGFSGGTTGHSWIDMFARGTVNIIGDTSGTLFDVHANMGLTNGHAGTIHIASLSSTVQTSGTAIQASDTGSGSSGGDITIEAALAVNLDDSQIFAQGDFNATGGFGTGGKITVQSFSGSLSWQETAAPPASIGDVRPTGSGILAAQRGVITFINCTGGSVNTTGTLFPFIGLSATTPTTVPGGACGGAPTLQPYVLAGLPAANCGAACLPRVTPTPTSTPTSTRTTTPTTVTPTPTPTPFCNKLPVQTVLAGRVPDVIVRTDLGQSIQAAINTASDINGDGYIIIGVVSNGTGALGGSTTQNVVIDQVFPKPFLLIGCSVTMINPAANAGNPTGWIKPGAGVTSPPGGNIFVMDIHGSGSDVAGWKVEGDGRELRNVGNSTSAVGAWFAGNNNTMHNGSALHNTGVGVLINGDGNIVTDTLVEFNGGNGVEVHGNNNQILKTQLGDVSGRGNLGDGLNVSGDGNLLSENTARANSLDGIHVVTGTGNTLTKNLSGGTSSQDNGDCEYDVAASNINGGENKANGVTVVGSPFPTGCLGTP